MLSTKVPCSAVCHSGLDLACPVIDTGESSLFAGFLMEFIPMKIGTGMTKFAVINGAV
jgi:hypothetical protein